jgi:hypothetical protein
MTWLHNMSGAPRAVIVQHADSGHDLTDGVLLRFDETVKDTSGKAILARLGITERLSPRAANARLCTLINQRALSLPYPPAAIVSDRATGREREETDLLSVCAVLSKSSAKLYLRDKEPNLSGIQLSRRVILLVPKGWRPV